jgi:NhaA family Na+:H+ antiporter
MNSFDGDNGKNSSKSLEENMERVITPFQKFIHHQTTGSIFLILCTAIALFIANSPLADDYEIFIEIPIGLIFDEWSFKMSVRHWVNDGLMSLFFFMLGLEIKREFLAGELRKPRQFIPVLAAALGGMLIPAVIFSIFNTDLITSHGWGIPMATDTAFAVGILALLANRVPASLVVFLAALAIIDDIGAILVVAVYYTETIDISYLALATFLLVFLAGCNILGFRHPIIYFIGGGIVWLAMLGSGVHATVAGILVALTVPARPKRSSIWFINRTRDLVNKFENIEKETKRSILGEKKQHEVVEQVQDSAEKASTPLRRWENALETPVVLFVMPIFALVNAGIPIGYKTLTTIGHNSLSLGILLGLVAGKSIGISFFTWIVLRLNLGALPQNVNMNHVIGIGLLGGMGFTMSIFIAGLGFDNNPEALLSAKSAILLSSLIAGISGYVWLRLRG